MYCNLPRSCGKLRLVMLRKVHMRREVFSKAFMLISNAYFHELHHVPVQVLLVCLLLEIKTGLYSAKGLKYLT